MSVLPVAAQTAPPAKLPYDRTCPVVYDNDYANDYVDWYLMALASAGDIRYRGISTSSSIAPHNRHMPADALDDCLTLRAKIVGIGRASGLRSIPQSVAGTRGHLIRPASARIEDTKPIDAPGSRQIVREAKAATVEKPLVVCVGGPLTVVADAYLLDKSIADRLVVAWLDNYRDGMYGFNGWSDGWAAYYRPREAQARAVHRGQQSVRQRPQGPAAKRTARHADA